MPKNNRPSVDSEIVRTAADGKETVIYVRGYYDRPDPAAGRPLAYIEDVDVLQPRDVELTDAEYDQALEKLSLEDPSDWEEESDADDFETDDPNDYPPDAPEY
jgi:hypothetical protein